MDQLAYIIGWTMLAIGGPLFALLVLIVLGWVVFEEVSRRIGWTKRIFEWRQAAIRERDGIPAE